jgi:hypothetical protein
MFNRTLNRPMFRRGGRASGGIMTGVQRPGYEEGNSVGGDLKSADFKTQNTGESSDLNKVAQVKQQTEFFNKAFPKYNNMGSDFFMGLGANILAAPGGNPILQTIGTAAKEPLNLMMKQNMANTQGDRDLALAMWKNLDDETKTRMMKDAQYLVDQGVFPNIQEALKSEIYSKSKSPADRKNTRIRELENTILSTDMTGALTSVAQDIAEHIYNLQTGAYDGAVDEAGNDLEFSKVKTFFKDGDIGRFGTKEDGSNIYELSESGKTKWGPYEGLVVYDYRTGKLFKKQGNNFIEVTIGEKQIEE